jgi:hypothetical protein
VAAQGPSWDNRRLCDDGACTGLIGSDGVCRECGKPVPFWGDERRRGMQNEGDEAIDEEPGAAAVHAGEGGGERVRERDDDENDRALCPDGACTGLLDADGRCKVCGKVDPNAVIAMRTDKRDDDDDAGEDGDGDGEGDEDDAADGGGDERKLCPDGGCTGLLGSDGKCKVCGRSAEA